MLFKLSSYLLNKISFRAFSMNSTEIMNSCKELLPPLLETSHKGICGRLGVFGGSIEFTGAPYFASISAMRTGADLVYVFTSSSAAPVIKTYSPELMVLPYLDSASYLENISPWLVRLHALLIGPGLGRNVTTFENILKIVELIKETPDDQGVFRPIIFDADGLFFLSKNPTILQNYQGDIYLTPNVMEFKNLAKTVLNCESEYFNEDSHNIIASLAKEIGKNVTIVLKGKTDQIGNQGLIVCCSEEGSNRRCGGQGDLLSGVLSTFAIWVTARRKKNLPQLCDIMTDTMLAGYSACALTRLSNKAAFQIYSRSMMTTDMIEIYPKVFSSIFNC